MPGIALAPQGEHKGYSAETLRKARGNSGYMYGEKGKNAQGEATPGKRYLRQIQISQMSIWYQV